MTAKQVLEFKHAFAKRKFILIVNDRKMGLALRKMREDAEISLRRMARKIGCSAPFLSDCERGNRSMNIRHLKLFLEACQQ